MSDYFIRNTSSATVVIAVPELNFRVSLIPNRVFPISEQNYRNLQFDPGVVEMEQNGIVQFFSKEDAIPKTLEDALVAQKDKEDVTLATSEVRALLEKKDITALVNVLSKASIGTKESIVQEAVRQKLGDHGFVAVIQKYTGVNILKALAEEQPA